MINTLSVAAVTLDMAASRVNFTINMPPWLGTAVLNPALVSSTGSTPLGSATLGFGAQSIAFLRTTIPKGSYFSVEVNLQVANTAVPQSQTLSPSLEVVGLVQYTQYNVPAEPQCGGAADRDIYVVSDLKKCQVKTVAFKGVFVDQVYINGTGQSTDQGLVKIAAATSVLTSCAKKLPPDASSSNTFLKVPSVTGSCNIPVIANEGVAVPASLKTTTLPCNALIELSNTDQSTFASRKVVDTCPGCAAIKAGADNHIDSFSGSQACTGHGVGDLGDFWTRKK